MTYEEVIERVKAVPQERLEELDRYIVHWVGKQSTQTSSTKNDRQTAGEHKRAQKRHEAYNALQQFRGIVHRNIDCKKELAEALDERFASAN